MNTVLPPNEDRGPKLVALFWSLIAVAYLFVAARFYARHVIRGIGLDDWMILVSIVGSCHALLSGTLMNMCIFEK